MSIASTREAGLYGFRYQNEDYLLINHVSSEIAGLGEHIFYFLKELLNGSEEEKKEKIAHLTNNLTQIVKVKPHHEMTKEAKEYIKEFHQNFGLSDEVNLELSDWSSFFSQEQGNMFMYYDGFKYLLDSSNYITMSGEIKYVYIINFDDEVFEIYYGNNKQQGAPEQGRYANQQHPFLHDGYWGVTLEKTIPFAQIDVDKSLMEQL